MSVLDSLGSLFDSIGEFMPAVSAGAQLFGGFQANKRYQQQAVDISGIGEREAQQTLIAGQVDARNLVREGRKTIGMAEARAGAGGLQMRGSVLDSVASSYANLKIDEMNTLYNANRQAALQRERARATSRATSDQGRGELTRSLGSAAMTLAQSGLFSSKEGI